MSRSTLAALLVLAGCRDAPKEMDPIRPVLSIVVGSSAPRDRSFVGTLEGRYTTQLAFSVGGRVVRRSVSVGDRVKRGQEIAALDTESLRLAVSAAAADAAGALASRENAVVTLGRQTKLFEQRTNARASLDTARAGHEVAQANADEAAARLDKARHDLSYGILRAEFDGIITRVDFEVGQVVAPNVAIAEIVRPDALDFVFDVPESVARELSVGDGFDVHGEDASSTKTHGTVRQVSPSADGATRTRRIRVALDTVPVPLRLGTTMYAERSGDVAPSIRVPSTAVLEGAGATAVWVVEGSAVHRRAVTLGARTDDDVVVQTGLRAGDRVVTAGVHSMTDGQEVKGTEEASR